MHEEYLIKLFLNILSHRSWSFLKWALCKEMWAYSLMNLWVCVKNQLALGCLESQKSKESDFNWVKAFKRATLRLGLLRSLEKQPSRQKQGDPQILPLSFMLLFFYPLSARKGNVHRETIFYFHFYSSFLSCRNFLVTPSLEKNNLRLNLSWFTSRFLFFIIW